MTSSPPLAITAHSRTIAIIGDPIEHSLTPRIQNAALRVLGADIVNVAFRVAPADLAQAVQGARALGLLGLMVTIPHKEAVLAQCDELDESARLMGAANLLHFTAGKTVGHSTDGWAALTSLGEAGVAVKGAAIAIVGGGGAARSLALSFARQGARQLILLNRTVERAQKIALEVNALGVAARATACDEVHLRLALEDCNLLVNATSVGMAPHAEACPVPTSILHRGLAVYDIVYNPLRTRLLRAAHEAGAVAVDGLGMLIYTNVAAVRICAGLDASAQVMRREALLALQV